MKFPISPTVVKIIGYFFIAAGVVNFILAAVKGCIDIPGLRVYNLLHIDVPLAVGTATLAIGCCLGEMETRIRKLEGK